MGIPYQLSYSDGGGTVPFTVGVDSAIDLRIFSIVARWNGAAASGDFHPCCSLYSPNNVLISRTRPEQVFSPGDSGVVTYAPFLHSEEEPAVGRAHVGSFLTPAATGSHAVTGLGYQPTWVFFAAVDATAVDTWHLGTSCISFGLMSTDGSGNMVAACNRRQFTSTTAASSTFDTGVAIEVGSARGTMGQNVIFSAQPVSLDADGFTLNFTTAAANYRVMWCAGNDPAAAGSGFFTAAGDLGFNAGAAPTALFHVGISDVLPGLPSLWTGDAFTGLFGCGKTGTVLSDNECISWSPGYNTAEQYNELAYPGFGADWGAADDPFAFGTVIQGACAGRSNGNDLRVTSFGAGVGSYIAAIGFRPDARAAQEFNGSSTPGAATDRTFAFSPTLALTLGGNTFDRFSQNLLATGASLGAVDAQGNQWLIACGTKMGTGAASYMSTVASWMSGWNPFDNPTGMTYGTSALDGTTLRYRTVSGGDSTVRLRCAAFDNQEL